MAILSPRTISKLNSRQDKRGNATLKEDGFEYRRRETKHTVTFSITTQKEVADARDTLIDDILEDDN